MFDSLPPSSPPPSSPMSSTTVLSMAETPIASSSTAASSPPPVDEETKDDVVEDEEEISEEDKKKWEQLGPFLEKVTVYAKALKEQMDKAKATYGKQSQTESTKPQSKAIPKSHPTSIPKFETAHKPTSSRHPKLPSARGRGKGRKRTRVEEPPEPEVDQDELDHSAKRAKVSAENEPRAEDTQEEEDTTTFQQPALVTGATLRDYQLEGVAWMVGLFQNGISGILADEMGLGKTLQTIAFHAYLRERSSAPFLVVCPLSVLYNWAEEFQKFAPAIPVCIYHGSPEDRAELRRTQMVLPEADRKDYWLGHTVPTPRPSGKSGGRPKRGRGKGGSSRTAKHVEDEDETNDVTQGTSPHAEVKDNDAKSEGGSLPKQKTTFPVVLTTYEILMRDRAYLAEYRWGFIVVDEGHRLKNMDCRLMHEMKQLQADGRMVLTGTPLQNNLAELWSLLNFVLPGVFTDLDTFQEWFNLPGIQVTASGRTAKVIHSLHAILRPFLLRRLKVDVETGLPPKKEYVLYAPLSKKQHELYDAILQGGLRALLLKEKGVKKDQLLIGKENTGKDEDVDEGVSLGTRSHDKRRKKGKRYNHDEDDDEYFKKLESGEMEAHKMREKERSAEELGREWHLKAQLKKVNNMKLQNTVMQLRKVCSHPFLFDWPVDSKTMQPVLDDELVSVSGKMMVLDRLLDALFEKGHKVLLFSQFTTMLDIIEDWATEFKHWPICRIDGSTSMEDRRSEVHRFENGGDDDEDGPSLFLLSTRAGGLGLNLVAADTVIFYDQDWNPQMDLQAQARAHRIGQTRPVLIFRLVSAHTIETKIMQRATEKRKLEALVIAKGKFKAPAQAAGGRNGNGRQETMAEMAASLLRLEGEKIQVVPNTDAGKKSVISDQELEILLDRSPEVFVDRGKGWTSSKAAEEKVAGAKEREGTAFAVYDAPVDEGGNALAGMMGEESDVD